MAESQPAVPLCARCKSSPGTVAGRNDPLCSTCFLSYARSKPIKRMDPFRVRNTPNNTPPPLLLFAFSFGVSSLTLLHILKEQMSSQRTRVGRTGYELLVVWVDDSGLSGDESGRVRKQETFKDLESHFGGEGSGITFKSVRLEDIYTYAYAYSQPQDTGEGTNLGKLRALISSLPSLSSKKDILTTLLNRLLTLLALQHSCSTILFSHSTTRLAEKTLSETAKGRGYSVPWSTSDCTIPLPPPPSPQSPKHQLQTLYPLRDLLRKELHTYIDLTPSLQPFHIPSSSSSTSTSSPQSLIPTSAAKDTSIDSLMHQYFSQMEQTYPSIVANVVKTIGRVPAPHASVTSAEVQAGVEQSAPSCAVCGFPIDMGEADVWEEEDRDVKKLSAGVLLELGVGVEELCGGCRRSLEGVKEGVGVKWPL